MTAIILKNVQKRYSAHHPPVLTSVNLSLAEGEFCVFIGPSGCGKSTLLRVIAGLEDVTEGEVWIGGERMDKVPPAERGVAMVFQSYALFPHMSVYENMAFGLELAKVPKDEIRRKVLAVAQTLQLELLLDRKPKALSGGQRQRVAIGRAIVRSPRVFLFDEPLSNLDTALRAQTRIEIARLHKNFPQASMVYVTHDQVEAMTLADRIVLLHTGEAVQKKGSLAQVGSPMDLFHRPCNLFVAGFIGSPKMNFLAGTVQAVAPGRVTVATASGALLAASVDGAGLAPGQAVTLGIRPEHVTAAGQADQTLAGPVDFVERLGTATYVYLQHGPGELFVAAEPGDSHTRPGAVLELGVPADAMHLFDQQGDALRRTVALPE